MLGMIFGVAAVVAMLSIGAGAQQEVMAFIEQLGVRNLIVEAREAPDQQALQKIGGGGRLGQYLFVTERCRTCRRALQGEHQRRVAGSRAARAELLAERAAQVMEHEAQRFQAIHGWLQLSVGT